MSKFFRILFFPLALIRLLLLILSSLFFMCTVIIEDKISHKKGSFIFWSARYWGKISLFILGIYVKKNSLPLHSKYLLMPNHSSYLDILLLAAYSPSAFVAKAELLKWPIIGKALKSSRAIMVNRKELKSLLNTLDKIKQSIENNISITVFPEGTTSLGPQLLPFKKGTFKIAADLQIPIIPCAIYYWDINNAWCNKINIFRHYFRQFCNPISIVSLQFGTPVQSTDYKGLKDKTKASIETMLNSIHNNI